MADSTHKKKKVFDPMLCPVVSVGNLSNLERISIDTIITHTILVIFVNIIDAVILFEIIA